MEETIYLIHFHGLVTISRVLMEPIMRILEINIQRFHKTNFNLGFYNFKSKEIPIFYVSVESKNCPSEHISLYSEKATKE